MAHSLDRSSVIKSLLGLNSAHSPSTGSGRQSNRSGGNSRRSSPVGSTRDFNVEKSGRGVSKVKLWRNRHFRGFRFSVLKKVIFGPRTESEQSRNDKAKEEDLQRAFSVFDKDGDGYINALELRSVLMSLKIKEGARLTKCEQMIKEVDVDGNGKVDFQEFKKMMSSDGCKL